MTGFWRGCGSLMLCGWLTAMAGGAEPAKSDATKSDPGKPAPAKAEPAAPKAPANAARKPDPSLAPITDDPMLPRVLLIGDSISMGYTIPVRKLLDDVANVHRIATNGGPTINGTQNIDKWLGNAKWDVIHFNFGLHDIKMMDGKHQVPIDQYEANLREIVGKLKKTGAKLIWCSTTPVPDAELNPIRRVQDVIDFNAVAKKVMDENGIAIDDLYSFALPRLKEIQRPANVHFTDTGSQALAEVVAKQIRDALPKK